MICQSLSATERLNIEFRILIYNSELQIPTMETVPSSGGDSEGVTPDPIPNSAVKPLCADGTAREVVWESRTLPDLNQALRSNRLRAFLRSTIESRCAAVAARPGRLRRLCVTVLAETHATSNRTGPLRSASRYCAGRVGRCRISIKPLGLTA